MANKNDRNKNKINLRLVEIVSSAQSTSRTTATWIHFFSKCDNEWVEKNTEMLQPIHTSPTKIECYLCQADFKNLGLLHHHQITVHTAQDLSLAVLSVQCHDFSKLDTNDDGNEAVFLRHGLSKYPRYVKSDQKQNNSDYITIIELQGTNTKVFRHKETELFINESNSLSMLGKKMPGEVNNSATSASNDLGRSYSGNGYNTASRRKRRAHYHTTLDPTLHMTCSSDEEKDNTNRTSKTSGSQQNEVDTAKVNQVLNLGDIKKNSLDATVDAMHIEGLERVNKCTESSDNPGDTNCKSTSCMETMAPSNRMGPPSREEPGAGQGDNVTTSPITASHNTRVHIDLAEENQVSREFNHFKSQIETGRLTVEIGCSAHMEMHNKGSQTYVIQQKKGLGLSSPVRRLAEVRIKRTGRDEGVACTSLAQEPQLTYRRILRSHKHTVLYTKNTTERKFKCTKCEKMYTKKSHLDRHCRSHTEECPYICSHCNKRFTTHSVFKQHFHVHVNEKTYSCSACLKQFHQKTNLLTHIIQHNTKRFKLCFKCFCCNKAFVSNQKLISHRKYYCHGTSQTCKICLMHFYTTGALKEHYNVHKIPIQHQK